jgi:hypothetical protein
MQLCHVNTFPCEPELSPTEMLGIIVYPRRKCFAVLLSMLTQGLPACPGVNVEFSRQLLHYTLQFQGIWSRM